ncbi:MAG: hypothetical protein ACPG4T_06875 [Nannocystaceae bacterium]
MNRPTDLETNAYEDFEQSLGDSCHSMVDTHRLAGLLQPYIDGTIADNDREWVDTMAASDSGVAELLLEQTEVRSALQELAPVRAPQALHARVLLELDAIDHEQAVTPAEPRQPRWRQRLRALFRGAAIMVPAGATAVALFFVVRTGFAPPANEAPVSSALSADIGSGQLPIQLGNGSADQPGLEPVALSANQPSNSAKVVYSINGKLVIDSQQRARTPTPTGTRIKYREREFFVEATAGGSVIRFRKNGVDHALSYDPSRSPRGDLHDGLLLEVGHMLASDASASSAPR